MTICHVIPFIDPLLDIPEQYYRVWTRRIIHDLDHLEPSASKRYTPSELRKHVDCGASAAAKWTYIFHRLSEPVFEPICLSMKYLWMHLDLIIQLQSVDKDMQLFLLVFLKALQEQYYANKNQIRRLCWFSQRMHAISTSIWIEDKMYSVWCRICWECRILHRISFHSWHCYLSSRSWSSIPESRW
jgi:hypothetical protein